MGWYYDRYYKPAKPKKVKNGIKAKTQRGSFGGTWWSKRWISVLESFGWSNRLQRGRTYARKGQVVDIDIQKGEVRSHVQGTHRTPYRVKIEMEQIPDKDWEKVSDAMAEQAIFAAKLLAGDMPEDIEDAFKSAHISLFPSERDLETDCSCPDWANPCKHIAAVYYLLGERFDEDPFLIFLLRGRSKEELMEMLRGRRAEVDRPSGRPGGDKTDGIRSGFRSDPGKPPELAADHSFWEFKESMDDFRIEISLPAVELAALKRLGKPAFWKSRKEFSKVFGPAYADTSDSVYIQSRLEERKNRNHKSYE